MRYVKYINADGTNVMAWKRADITDEMIVAEYARSGVHGDMFPPERLMARLGAPEKVVYAACERACDRGLIDYGVSLRAGWLTDKGRALMDAETLS